MRSIVLAAVTVLLLAGCSSPAPTAIVQSAATTPQTGKLDTSMPIESPTVSGGSLDSGDGDTTDSTSGASEDDFADNPSESAYLKAVKASGYTAGARALRFGREVCDNVNNYADDQDDAISNSDDSYYSDGTNSAIATLAEDKLCPLGDMTKATTRWIKGLHETMFTITSVSGVASVTYDDDNDISQENDVRLPWHKSFDENDDVNLTVQNGGGGTITCTVSNGNGDNGTAHRSTGAYAIVSC